ncbi:Imm8 family immunity protein [Ensifer adhaerens]|uniref:Imm8 family immunity protein n=1 Tax=Ensifer adhaerens TaxID=106592 RepID=UPI003D05CD33
MKAVIWDLYPIGSSFDSFYPDDVKNFYFAAEALIGPEEGQGYEIFSFEVCTPSWFEENRLDAPTFARHCIFMKEYNSGALIQLVRDAVSSTQGETWTELANKLGRLMFWEFEDYEA